MRLLQTTVVHSGRSAATNRITPDAGWDVAATTDSNKKKGAIVPRSISEATDEMDFQLLGPGPPRDKLVSKPCKVRSEIESQAPFFFSHGVPYIQTTASVSVYGTVSRCSAARNLEGLFQFRSTVDKLACCFALVHFVSPSPVPTGVERGEKEEF